MRENATNVGEFMSIYRHICYYVYIYTGSSFCCMIVRRAEVFAVVNIANKMLCLCLLRVCGW